MANYCALDDVQGWLPSEHKIDDQVGSPTGPTVTGWCADVTNDVNVALKQGGNTVPVTDTDLLGKLKLRCARELAYEVMATRTTVKNEKVTPLYAAWHTEFEAMLTTLATKGTSATGVSTVSPSLGVSDQEPAFTRDMVL